MRTSHIADTSFDQGPKRSPPANPTAPQDKHAPPNQSSAEHERAEQRRHIHRHLLLKQSITPNDGDPGVSALCHLTWFAFMPTLNGMGIEGCGFTTRSFTRKRFRAKFREAGKAGLSPQ